MTPPVFEKRIPIFNLGRKEAGSRTEGGWKKRDLAEWRGGDELHMKRRGRETRRRERKQGLSADKDNLILYGRKGLVKARKQKQVVERIPFHGKKRFKRKFHVSYR